MAGERASRAILPTSADSEPQVVFSTTKENSFTRVNPVFTRFDKFDSTRLDDGGKTYTTKKQQDQRGTTRGIFVGVPARQAGWETCLEDRIGTSHLTVSADCVFDEDFKTSISTTVEPFQGAQLLLLRTAGTLHPLESYHDGTHHHAGDVEEILHPEHSAKGEDENVTSPIDDGHEYEIDSIIDHKQVKGGHHRFRVKWATGETTWEPDENLKDLVIFTKYLRERSLADIKRYLSVSVSFQVSVFLLAHDKRISTDELRARVVSVAKSESGGSRRL